MSATGDDLLQSATFLFDLLDDIDTASDRAKGDDKLYRQIVERIQRRRFEVAQTNGHSLTFEARAPTPVERDLKALDLAREAHRRVRGSLDEHQAIAIIQVAILDGMEFAPAPVQPGEAVLPTEATIVGLHTIRALLRGEQVSHGCILLIPASDISNEDFEVRAVGGRRE